jgi:hypothetical protein
MLGFRSNNELRGPSGTESFKTLNNSSISSPYGIDDVISLTVSSNGTEYIILAEESVSPIIPRTDFVAYFVGYVLPSPALNTGKTIYVKNSGSWNYIYDINNTNILYENQVTPGVPILSNQTLGFYSIGTNWIVITNTDNLENKIINLSLTTGSTINLPPAYTHKKTNFNIIKNNISGVLIDTGSSSTHIININNANVGSVYTTGSETRLTFSSDGNNWYITNRQ